MADKPARRAHNSSAPSTILFRGVAHNGPASIYKAAKESRVTLNTFTSRFRKLIASSRLSGPNIEECLTLTTEEFKRKYATRRTYLEVDGESVDLLNYFENACEPPSVSYRNFWQRVRSLSLREKVSQHSLAQARTLTNAEWFSFYGGGRSKSFIYSGEEYPEHNGSSFHSIAAFLRTIGKYEDCSTIWSRLKAGWNLDDALTIPVTFPGLRSGSIYRITRRKTGQIYVGLTVTEIGQRWAFHVSAAMKGSSSKLHEAIREDGPSGFDVDALEEGIADPNHLSAREKYWAHHFKCIGPSGLNTAKPGGLGSPAGKRIEYKGEIFRSIEEASDVLSKRLAIAAHVIRSRLQKGQTIPDAKQVRKHSKHPDAGSNLFRRWLGLKKRHPGIIDESWLSSFDKFKADISPVPKNMELVRRIETLPWGPDNFEWVTTKTKVERIHGISMTYKGVKYPTINALANAHGIGVSTLKHRLYQSGMTLEEAMETPLADTSFRKSSGRIEVDGQAFRSKRQAILHIAQSRGITEHQAKYRFSIGKY